MSKVALITGITGQDGSYLAELLLENGKPDYRIQKWNNYNGYKDMYLCDNFMQFKLAIEDPEYTKWLDPAGVPCYVKDV